jgi:hypothetical protein
MQVDKMSVPCFGLFGSQSNDEAHSDWKNLSLHIGLLMPHLTETLLPHLTETLLPHLTETLLPQLTETLLPQLTEMLLPHLTEMLLPHLTETLLPHLTETVHASSATLAHGGSKLIGSKSASTLDWPLNWPEHSTDTLDTKKSGSIV